MIKKIAFITKDMNQIGGVERVVTLLSNSLCEKYNYEIEIISVFSNDIYKNEFLVLNPKIKSDFLGLGLKKIDNPLKRIINEYKSYKKVNEYLINRNYDIVISTHDFISNYLIKRKGMKKTKFIGCEHREYYAVNKLRILINTILYKRLDKVVVLTNEDKKLHDRFLKNVIAIPNMKSFSSEIKANLDSKVILAVGRLSKEKGFDYLIESFNLAVKYNSDWKLFIVGQGEEKSNLEEKIRELNLEDKVKILNFTKDIEKYYLKASIYALSSRTEGFPMVLLEAMSYGIPCISFDLSGAKEIINDGIDGTLVPKYNIEEFADKLKYMMDNYEVRVKYGENAKVNIERFSEEIVIEKWNRLFNEL